MFVNNILPKYRSNLGKMCRIPPTLSHRDHVFNCLATRYRKFSHVGHVVILRSTKIILTKPRIL